MAVAESAVDVSYSKTGRTAGSIWTGAATTETPAVAAAAAAEAVDGRILGIDSKRINAEPSACVCVCECVCV